MCPQGHWFDRATLSFFDSRISGGWRTHDGSTYIFTTSERPPQGERRYSVRVLLTCGEELGIQTVGAFLAYASQREAQREAYRLAVAYCDRAGHKLPRR